MNISFHGACREVTGSCILIETGLTKFLVDCGMFQGRSSYKNFDNFSFNPEEIDFVLLTHAHLDHCGRLPKLFMEGFRGRIYSTNPTKDLAEIILLDALNISRLEKRPFVAKDCQEKDIIELMRFFTSLNYGEEREINDSIRIRLRNSGHILGSSIFEVWVKENKVTKKLVFSGDLGNYPASIVRDPEFIDEADILFIESTYGNRLHESRKEGIEILKNKIKENIDKNGVLMIPSFALERTQELLYEINDFFEKENINNVKVFLDSPLALKATNIYRKYLEFYDEESIKLISSGDDIFDFNGLKMIKNRFESSKVFEANPPKIILAGSGMFEGGKIGMYIKKYIEDPKNTLLIVSFQVDGSLGKKFIDGEKSINIDGKNVQIRADVSTIFSFSSHSDHQMLLNWVNRIKIKPKKIFVVHGEENASIFLAQKINGEVPFYKEIYNL